jgi:hypothetical protein
MDIITISPIRHRLGRVSDRRSQPTRQHIHLPWVQFINPFDKPHRAVLTVDTTQATDLLGLTLEVGGDGWHEPLEIGGRTDVLLHEQLESAARMRDARLVLRLSATLPAGLSPELELPIGLSFTLDGEVIGGYHFIVRVGSLAQATGQVLDRLAGALQHLASGFALESATSAARSITQIIRSYGTQMERALEALRRKAGSMRDLANAIHGSPEPEAVIIQRGLFELAGVIAGLGKSTEPEQMIARIRGVVDRIQEPAGQVAQRRLSAQKGAPEAIAERPHLRQI